MFRLFGIFALLFVSMASYSDESSPIAARIVVCESCHGGENGIPVNETTPILAGQEYYYMYVQLKDYKAGRRANPNMSAMVQDLTKEDMKALAEHFSTKEWPRVIADSDDSKAAAGESALSAGQCSQCHSTYKGDSRVPRLAGQQRLYLQQTMSDFKNKVRLNSPAKGSLMDSFDEDALQAMAYHLSNL